jgi:2-hydroxychromene-2-carboxylate isomerase
MNMNNEQLTQAVVSLTEAVELLQKQMRGVREENLVMLEDVPEVARQLRDAALLASHARTVFGSPPFIAVGEASGFQPIEVRA